jgi:ADP-heptose:LPS heptosyltransferase
LADNVAVAREAHGLKDLAYQVQHARLVVSVDTSVAHVADLIGTPLVVLFGASNHFIHAPMFTDSRWITRRVEEETTEDIPVERVHRAVSDLLDYS